MNAQSPLKQDPDYLKQRIMTHLGNGGSDGWDIQSLVDAVLLDICGSTDFRQMRQAANQHGEQVRRVLRMALDRGEVTLGPKMNILLAS